FRAVLERLRRRLPRRRRQTAALGRAPHLDDVPPAHPSRDRGERRRPASAVSDRAVPDCGLAGARDLRPVRDHLRRPPRADPDHDAGRLGRPPATQGLPARRRAGRVQGRVHPTTRREEGVLLMTTTDDPYASTRDTTEGPVYTVTGGDWEAL